MKTLLLAAGRSQRMTPIEDKNFLSFCGKPLIQHQLEALVESGLNDILIIGGKHNLKVLNEFAEQFLTKKKNLKLKVIEQEDLKAGMAGAVLAAEWAVSPQDSLFIVSGNDVVDKEAYRLMFAASGNESFSGFLLGKRVKSYFPGGYLKTDKRGEIKSIVEKPGAGKEPSDLVNLVLHFHRNAGELHKYLKSIKSARDDRYEKALDQMIKDGVKMQVVAYDGYWQAIKYPWHVLEVARHFFEIIPKRISPFAKVDKKANITGD
ncbi:MAG: sugar phosphate nucleotidyltransferase, partial [Candidatus Gracilibacteria bacterium]